MRFHRKDNLRTARSTVSPTRRLIGVGRAGIHIDVRHMVGACQTTCHALAEVVASGNMIGAIAKVGPRLTRHQGAVLHNAGFELKNSRAPWRAAEKILVAFVSDFDGPAAFLG